MPLIMSTEVANNCLVIFVLKGDGRRDDFCPEEFTD